MSLLPDLSLETLRQFYASGGTPEQLVREVYRRIEERGQDAVWIYRPSLENALASLPIDRSLPLFGVPFAVKDNIDVAHWPTTAACPDFTYIAHQDATVIRRLREAGAIPIGKTNLDQFATGLVGTRSPYGAPRSVFDKRYISGGSSSGSAVAVAAGLVSFSLGTDTAGSGRVPAAFNNIVGLKPTKGLLSTSGVVPACRSLDCVSVFGRNIADSERVLDVAQGHDASDPFSRHSVEHRPASKTLRIGVPAAGQLEFFGDFAAEELFHEAVERLVSFGHERVEVDLAPFRDAAQLLYAGPWVAERLAAIESFITTQPESVHPVVRQIIQGGARYSAVETFRASYELQRLRALADQEWSRMDFLLLPTTPTTYTVAEVEADPVRLNSRLGYYTNFVNLLDLCGIAIPAGFRRTNGLPFGVTLLAPAFHDSLVCAVGREFLGEATDSIPSDGQIHLAVVGAHLCGQPLNYQLADRGALFIRTSRTAPHYRLFSLANTTPQKPGLVRSPGFVGPGIEVELWSLTPEAFGDFVAHVPPPMAIGTLELEDGTQSKGFLCEPCSLEGGRDITEYAGWRAFLSAR